MEQIETAGATRMQRFVIAFGVLAIVSEIVMIGAIGWFALNRYTDAAISRLQKQEPTDAKFRYGDRVYVERGFYRGREAKVVGFNEVSRSYTVMVEIEHDQHAATIAEDFLVQGVLVDGDGNVVWKPSSKLR